MNTQKNATVSIHEQQKIAKQKAGWDYYHDHKYLLTDSARSTTSTADTAHKLIQGFAHREPDETSALLEQRMLDTLERFRGIAHSVAVKVYGSVYFPHTGMYSSPRHSPVDYYFPKWLKAGYEFTVEAFDDQYVLLKSTKHEETPNFMYRRELLYRSMFSLSDRDFAKLFRHYCKSEKARLRLADLHYMDEEIRIMEQRKAYLLAGDAQRKELRKLAGYTGKWGL